MAAYSAELCGAVSRDEFFLFPPKPCPLSGLYCLSSVLPSSQARDLKVGCRVDLIRQLGTEEMDIKGAAKLSSTNSKLIFDSRSEKVLQQ